MRSRRHFKTSNNSYRRVNKKNNKSRNQFGYTHNVSILDIENINEVLRVHKSHLAEGKGSWKLVPKDSCEVYKDRQKRKSENNRQNGTDQNITTSDSDNVLEGTKKVQRRKGDKKVNKTAIRRRRKLKKRRRLQESLTSTSFSSRTTASSYISSSEMDYE